MLAERRKIGRICDNRFISYMALVGMKTTYEFPKDKSERADFIIDTVCKEFCIDKELLSKKTRVHEVVFPRQIVMYLLYKHTRMTIMKIGRIFNRDHTTVVHSKDLIKNLMWGNSVVRDTIAVLEAKIK